MKIFQKEPLLNTKLLRGKIDRDSFPGKLSSKLVDFSVCRKKFRPSYPAAE